jgi:hypothetical protein
VDEIGEETHDIRSATIHREESRSPYTIRKAAEIAVEDDGRGEQRVPMARP